MSEDTSCGRKEEEFGKEPANKNSKIAKVIAIVGGKGGVGKSLITSLLAVTAKRKGKNSAILDADITGPSIPKTFGISGKATGNENGILPMVTAGGIELISVNCLLENDSDPVVWRGPMLGNVVKQFWTDVVWGDVDYMFVDMPPGTGDVPLTVFQSLPIDGIIVVTSPQELVGMIVEKAVKMAEMMKVPVLGIVENMAYFDCPDCHERHYIYGQSHLAKTAENYKIKRTAQLPIDPILSDLCDKGGIENANAKYTDELEKLLF